jgi:hypothetical protein
MGEDGSPPTGADCERVTPASYEIRIKGRVGDPVLATFANLKASVRPAETVLRGVIKDQAALHGVIDRIQSLGLELIEIRQVGDPQTSRASES